MHFTDASWKFFVIEFSKLATCPSRGESRFPISALGDLLGPCPVMDGETAASMAEGSLRVKLFLPQRTGTGMPPKTLPSTSRG